jgi:hypothetical protein
VHLALGLGRIDVDDGRLQGLARAAQRLYVDAGQPGVEVEALL